MQHLHITPGPISVQPIHSCFIELASFHVLLFLLHLQCICYYDTSVRSEEGLFDTLSSDAIWPLLVHGLLLLQSVHTNTKIQKYKNAQIGYFYYILVHSLP